MIWSWTSVDGKYRAVLVRTRDGLKRAYRYDKASLTSGPGKAYDASRFPPFSQWLSGAIQSGRVQRVR